MAHLVSILIPAYNAERWIAETLRSALDQTWPNKEVIVVDDGSRDRTLQIAKTFESGMVKVVAHANGGACAARNHALTLAQGDYIQWLDADDLLHPEKIQRQLDCSDQGTPSSVLLTSAWTKFFFDTRKARFEPDPLWQELSPLEWIVTKFSHNLWMNPAVWLVSRRLTNLAGPWDVRLSSSGDDDGEYICRVVAASDGVKFVPQAKCYYRIGTVGSLNWNMERSEKGLAALLLSLELSTAHLLAMEDSERTRSACLQLLRNYLGYFYASDERLIAGLQRLATRLGATLERPSVSWKYYPFEKIAGPKNTKRIVNNWRAAKLLARRKIDSCLYELGI